MRYIAPMIGEVISNDEFNKNLSNGGTNTNAKMKRQEKAEKIGFILNELYPTTPIPLITTALTR